MTLIRQLDSIIMETRSMSEQRKKNLDLLCDEWYGENMRDEYLIAPVLMIIRSFESTEANVRLAHEMLNQSLNCKAVKALIKRKGLSHED